MRVLSMIALMVLFPVVTTFATIIHVPGDQPTIQAGIDAAQDGDAVLVDPGTYVENIDYHGKKITVKSSKGPKVTVIDGNQSGPVVTFISGETAKSALIGFTIRNGRASADNAFSGGGIYSNASSPTIRNNTITANIAAVGAGVEVYGGSPHIVNNKILSNIHDDDLSGGWGGGISLEHGSSAKVINNKISDHQFQLASGGAGVAIKMAGKPLLRGNFISANVGGPGPGVWIIDSSPSLIGNLIFRNTGDIGGGVYLDFSSQVFYALFVNNTFAENVSVDPVAPGDGSAAYIVGYDNRVQFFNNIFQSSKGREAFACFPGANTMPVLKSNDAFDSVGSGFGGTCAGTAGTNGNIALEPEFVNTSLDDYQLQATSPNIDMGFNSAPKLPAKDLNGKPRVQDGNGDGTAIVDIGAYEVQ